MPLLSPSQIHEVLKTEKREKSDNLTLETLLDQANLSKAEVLEELRYLMKNAETESVRAKCAELALKLNGLLSNEDKNASFHCNIIINDSAISGVNPILITR